MPQRQAELSTKQKALETNLDECHYGTIVEIGAGQEVARQFFSAGAAAGTVAKTMSAYDMQISDEIYGKAGGYVSRQRLEQMLSREFTLLNDRLADNRPTNTQFFSYAATVTARSYLQKNDSHGWIGLHIQLYPKAPASEIILHVRMLDEDNESQSEALGILGVNLIHATYNHKDNPKRIIESLLDNIEAGRMEIDLINFKGPYFTEVDNRLMNLHLVRSWCCRAVMFDTEGESIAPSSALRNRDILVMRGSYKPPTKVHMDMNKAALEQFRQVGSLSDKGILNVAEITMAELAGDNEQDEADFLARVDLLVKLGFNVLISDYLRFFRLRSWIRNFTSNNIAVVISVHDFKQLFDDSFYEGLEGGILVAMGKLFSDNTNVYVYPSRIDDELVTLETAKVPGALQQLLRYLIVNKSMLAIDNYNEENLGLLPKDIMAQIIDGQETWQQYVPEAIAKEITEKKLFGYGD